MDSNLIAGVLPDTEFGDLDALLAESLLEKETKAKVKRNRQKLADTKLEIPSTERAMIERTVRDWESTREWIAEAAVAMFTTQLCDWCGSRHSLFTGLLQRQRSRMSKVDRWVKVDANLLNDLPKETKHLTEHSNMCMSCVGTHRYPQGEI